MSGHKERHQGYKAGEWARKRDDDTASGCMADPSLQIDQPFCKMGLQKRETEKKRRASKAYLRLGMNYNKSHESGTGNPVFQLTLWIR